MSGSLSIKNWGFIKENFDDLRNKIQGKPSSNPWFNYYHRDADGYITDELTFFHKDLSMTLVIRVDVPKHNLLNLLFSDAKPSGSFSFHGYNSHYNTFLKHMSEEDAKELINKIFKLYKKSYYKLKDQTDKEYQDQKDELMKTLDGIAVV